MKSRRFVNAADVETFIEQAIEKDGIAYAKEFDTQKIIDEAFVYVSAAEAGLNGAGWYEKEDVDFGEILKAAAYEEFTVYVHDGLEGPFFDGEGNPWYEYGVTVMNPNDEDVFEVMASTRDGEKWEPQEIADAIHWESFEIVPGTEESKDTIRVRRIG